MKYIKLIWIFCVLLASFTHGLNAQDTPKIDINALVVSNEGQGIAGAIISNPSDNSTTITNDVGAFSWQVEEGTPLLVSAVGYVDKEVLATEALSEIVLEALVDEVQLLFRKVDRRDVLGGVSTLNVRELLEKNYVLGAVDGLNIHVGGFNGSSIWSLNNYLILIDGIPRDISDVRATEVESISVLKGAAAVAIYGSHAANGVIYITSKRGVDRDQQIDVRLNTGMHVRKQYPNYLSGADYKRFYNEALINDGEATRYSEDEINKTASGSNPTRYPNLDMYSSDFLSKAYNRTDVTAEIYGGDSKARYYTNIGFAREGSLLDFGEGAKASSQRFNLKGNVDVDLSDWLSAHVDAGAIFSSNRGPHGNYWEQAASFRGHRNNPLIPIDLIDLGDEENRNLLEASQHVIDGKYILSGTGQELTNIFADSYAAGFNKAIDRQLLFNTGVDMDLSSIVKGLAFRTKMGLDYNTTYNQGYTYTYRVFTPEWSETEGVEYISKLTPHGTDEKSNQQYVSDSWYQQTMFFSGQFDYKRTFDNRHNLFSMLVANNSQRSISGEYYKFTNTNLGYYLGYNYLNRYYLDFNGSVLYSTKLPDNNRTAFSPTVTVGWRLSDEGFMNGFSALDDLKLSATIGKIHSDIGIEEHYLYSQSYSYSQDGAGWFTWASAGAPITTSLQGGNDDMKAPYRQELSLGVDASLFNRKLQIEGNYFSIKTGDGLVQATELFPIYFATGYPNSSFIPYVNVNEEERNGFDFDLRYKETLGAVNWAFGVAGTYADTKITVRTDKYEYDYQNRVGRPINSIWGLQADGFFQDEDDIANSPEQTFGNVKPGDLKYKDQNGDGKIDAQDEVFLERSGTWDAPFVMGVNLTAKWRNLTFYAQGIGYFGGYGIKNRTTDWVYGERKYSDAVLDRWAYYTDPISGDVVDTRATATYPRLTTGNGNNNFRNSDFWLFSTDRFNISNVQITYSLPERMLTNTFFKKIDVYVAGANLLTISPEKEYFETNVGQAPQTRFYNLGVSASF